MKPFEQQTYYELLEVPVSASAEDIRVAYSRALETYGPDSVAVYTLEDPQRLEALRLRLGEAVRMLCDPALRRSYDRQLGLPERHLHAAHVPDMPGGAVCHGERRARPARRSALRPRWTLEYVAGGQQRAASLPPADAAPPAAAEASAPPAHASPPAAPALVVAPPPAPEERPAASEAPAAPAAAEAEAARPRPPGRQLGEAPQLAQEAAIASAEAALAQVAARTREPRPRPVEVPPEAEFTGELLRRVRESRGLSLQVLAERTRISARHLENLEADHYEALPVQVYLRGILMSVARELGLDGLRVSRSYLALASRPGKKG